MDSKERLAAPSCDTLSASAPETQCNVQMFTVTLKQEKEECTDEEESCSGSMYPSEPLKSSEYVNHYDIKSYVLELKQEFPEDERPETGCSVNSEIVSENKESLKLVDKEKLKNENSEEGLLLDIEEEDKDIEYQFTLKADRLEEQGILANAVDTSTHCDVLVTPQEVECKLCHKTFKNSCNLLKHTNEHIKVEINTPGYNVITELHQCQYCVKRFDNRDNMLAHISDVHSKKTFNCELCGKEFKRLSNLKRHILLLHELKKSPKKVTQNRVKCKYCNADFKQAYRLNNHMKLCRAGDENEEIEYKCDTCEGVYKSKKNLTSHIMRMHYDYGRTFSCWCGKQYRSPKQLTDHKFLNHGSKMKNEEYKCKCCEAVFQVRHSLTNHMNRVHSDYGRMFECYCGKKFRSPIHLRDHKRLRHDRKIKNTNNEKFQCDSCQKFFKTKQCLIVHIKRLHYDYGKVFECWCGKQFRSPMHLTEHKKAQHVLLYGGFKFCF